MSCIRFLLAALVCTLACPAAWADRSRLADDDDVVEAGDCEIEWAQGRQTVRGAARQSDSSLQLGCGIGWRTELAASWARRRAGGPPEQGIGLQAKTSLREGGHRGLGWALLVGVEGERGAGASWRRSGHAVAIEASLQPHRAWRAEARLGSARSRFERRDSTLWSLSVEHGLAEATQVRAELEGDDRSRPLAGLGLRYEVWPDLAALTLAYQLRGGPSRERRLGLALTIEF